MFIPEKKRTHDACEREYGHIGLAMFGSCHQTQEDTKKQVPLLSKKAIHHLRLFQIEESHDTFTKAYYLSKDSLESPDPDLRVLIQRTSKLLAAKKFQFSQSTFDSTRSTSTRPTSTLPSFTLVRKRLVKDLSYTEAQVLRATKARSLAELSFGEKEERFQEELRLGSQIVDF